MSKPVEVDETTFKQTVLESEIPVFVDFWGPHCQPCLKMAPFIDELAEQFDGRINFVKLNVGDNPQVANRYGVMGLPTIMIFKKGSPFSHLVGFRNKPDLMESLEEAL